MDRTQSDYTASKTANTRFSGIRGLLFSGAGNRSGATWPARCGEDLAVWACQSNLEVPPGAKIVAKCAFPCTDFVDRTGKTCTVMAETSEDES